jgi:hypothetical protein
LHPQYFKTNKQNQKAHQGLIVEHLKYTQGEATSTILPLSAEPVSLPSNAFGFLPELFFFCGTVVMSCGPGLGALCPWGPSFFLWKEVP